MRTLAKTIPEMIPRRWRKNGWSRTRLVSLFAACVAAVLVCGAGWATIFHAGRTQDANGYVLLAPLVTAWLLYARRVRFNVVQPRFDWIGLPAVAVGLGLYALWRSTDEPQLGGTLGTVLVLGGAAWCVVGRAVVYKFGWAWLALLLLNPIPARVVQPFSDGMQIATAKLACAVYDLLGVPSLVLENRIVCALGPGERILPLSATPDVLPMATALLTVTYGFVFASPIRGVVRTILLLLTPLAAILGGTAALVATMWLQHRGVVGDEGGRGTWEMLGQAAVLLLAFAGLMGVMRLLTWAAVPTRRYALATGR